MKAPSLSFATIFVLLVCASVGRAEHGTPSTNQRNGENVLRPVGSPPTSQSSQSRQGSTNAMDTALAQVPEELSSLYNISRNPQGKLVINPRPPQAQARGAQATRNALGGLDISPADAQGRRTEFASFRWERMTLRELLRVNGQLARAPQLNGWGLDDPRMVLRWSDDRGGSGTFVLSRTRPLGILSVCSQDVSSADLGVIENNTVVTARKPVIYLYPEERTPVTVKVKLTNMEFTSIYPKMRSNGTWKVIAEPSGQLTDPATGQTYSYLFWEARNTLPWQIDTSRASCVGREDAERFLESSLKTLGLNAKERNDFIVYWLPQFRKNPYTLVQFLTSEYTERAMLEIEPKPKTLVRVFMLIKGVEAPIHTSVALEPMNAPRKGFTVVEWGGADLDDRAR